MNENTTTESVKVGDIFSMSWGYDQTNNNLFQVTRVTPKGAYVREIGSKTVPGSQGFMCESVVPVKDSFLPKSQWCGGYNSNNPETFRRVKLCNNQWCFGFKGRYHAFKVNENSQHYRSWYA